MIMKMKSLAIVAAIALLAGFASCSSDDDNNLPDPVAPNNFVGKWANDSVAFDVQTGDSVNNEALKNALDEQNTGDKGFILFKQDNTFTKVVNTTDTINGTYSYSSDILDIKYNDSVDIKYNYQMNISNMKLTNKENPSDYQQIMDSLKLNIDSVIIERVQVFSKMTK